MKRYRHFLVVLGILVLFCRLSAAGAQEGSPCGRFVNEVSNWRTYRSAAMDGRFSDASRAREKLESSVGEKDLREFWDVVVPQESRVFVIVTRICQCGDGKCMKCEGSGTCPECKGELKCGLCGGLGQSVVPCTNCICAPCNGTGFCQSCLASKKAACSSCGGRKQTLASREVACKTCGGKGRLTSTGFSGETSRMCPNCKGRKTWSESYSVPCAKCGATGSVPCSKCSGTGRCVVCDGAKRKSGCSLCRDTGSISTRCPRCAGTGKCTACKGWKKCGSCEGGGKCLKCFGSALVELMRLPVDRRWLVHSEGCVVEKASSWKLSGRALETFQTGSSAGFASAQDCSRLERNGLKLKRIPAAGEVLVISEKEDLEWVPRNVVP